MLVVETAHSEILPVFAGMIPDSGSAQLTPQHSPRIRGDDPGASTSVPMVAKFSPYSRG